MYLFSEEYSLTVSKTLFCCFSKDETLFFSSFSLDQIPVLLSKEQFIRKINKNIILLINKTDNKKLELIGVGFRATLKGKILNLQLGFSHDVNFDIPDSIKITVEKQTILTITGSDKQEVGMIASKIKSLRSPEPYKGKGIRAVSYTHLTLPTNREV